MEDKSLTSMVITVIVALIVTGAVLVPIIGGLAGSGGNGGGSGGGEDTAEQYVYSNYNSIDADDIGYFLTAEDGRKDNIVYDWDTILFLGSGFNGMFSKSDDVGVRFYFDYGDNDDYIFAIVEFDTSSFDTISEEIYEKVSNATLTVYPDNRVSINLTYVADVETNK